MTAFPQFINEHGKRMVIVNKSIADMCRKEGIDMEKENIVESIPIDPKTAPAFHGTVTAETIDAVNQQLNEMVIPDGPRQYVWTDGNIYIINTDGSVEFSSPWDENAGPPNVAAFEKSIVDHFAKYNAIQPVTRSIVRNLTTSHKQHHTAPDGRRYVDTGKGWRRV